MTTMIKVIEFRYELKNNTIGDKNLCRNVFEALYQGTYNENKTEKERTNNFLSVINTIILVNYALNERVRRSKFTACGFAGM